MRQFKQIISIKIIGDLKSKSQNPRQLFLIKVPNNDDIYPAYYWFSLYETLGRGYARDCWKMQ